MGLGNEKHSLVHNKQQLHVVASEAVVVKPDTPKPETPTEFCTSEKLVGTPYSLSLGLLHYPLIHVLI